MVRLTLNFAGRPVRKYDLDGKAVRIGRDPDCEILIDNIGVSRHHARIEESSGCWVLTDLGSHNGTFVSGQRIARHSLSDGDEIFIGKYSLGFEAVDPSAADAPDRPATKAPKGMPEMTFHLDDQEIERIMGASTTGTVPKLALVAPEKERRSILLDNDYTVIGSHPSATVRIRGLLMPAIAAILVRGERGVHLLGVSRRIHAIVDGKRVVEHTLTDGELFRIGRRKFRYATS